MPCMTWRRPRAEQRGCSLRIFPPPLVRRTAHVLTSGRPPARQRLRRAPTPSGGQRRTASSADEATCACTPTSRRTTSSTATLPAGADVSCRRRHGECLNPRRLERDGPRVVSIRRGSRPLISCGLSLCWRLACVGAERLEGWTGASMEGETRFLRTARTRRRTVRLRRGHPACYRTPSEEGRIQAISGPIRHAPLSVDEKIPPCPGASRCRSTTRCCS